MCPNSYNTLTKREIRSSWSRLEHLSKSPFKPLASHIWPLFAPINMKCWTLLKVTPLASRKSYLAIIGGGGALFAPIHRLTKSEVGSNIAQNRLFSRYEVICGHYLCQFKWKVDQKWNWVNSPVIITLDPGQIAKEFILAGMCLDTCAN